MNKEQALHEFFSSFGVPAYDENTIPDDAKLPYITYSVTVDNYDNICPLNMAIWDKGQSWQSVTELSHEVAKKVDNMGRIRIDDGLVYITRGSPFAQRMADESNKEIRRIVINLWVNYLTSI